MGEPRRPSSARKGGLTGKSWKGVWGRGDDNAPMLISWSFLPYQITQENFLLACTKHTTKWGQWGAYQQQVYKWLRRQRLLLCSCKFHRMASLFQNKKEGKQPQWECIKCLASFKLRYLYEFNSWSKPFRWVLLWWIVYREDTWGRKN